MVKAGRGTGGQPRPRHATNSCSPLSTNTYKKHTHTCAHLQLRHLLRHLPQLGPQLICHRVRQEVALLVLVLVLVLLRRASLEATHQALKPARVKPPDGPLRP